MARPRGIDGVIRRMRAILRELPPEDGVAAFTRLYLAVTEAVSAQARQFENEPFLRALDVAFANLYFDALDALRSGNGAVPRAWAPLVEARGRPGVLPLQFALAGMNAHINRDLPVALVQTWKELALAPRRRSPERRDFRRVNALLEQTEARVKPTLVTGPVVAVDISLGRLDDVLAMWKVAKAREAAWVNAETLWALREAPALQRSFLRTLDRTIGLAGRGLLRPL
ncbi:MAG TPA: DUF5995 family protein [Myxococcota bacterium]|jgi:hypothetical protein|nr:DUF5995 family protein [Myxococcota bacterium]